MNCSDWGFVLSDGFKFFQQNNLEKDNKIETLDDILNKRIYMTNIIYDKSDINKISSFKLGDLVTPDFRQYNIFTSINIWSQDNEFVFGKDISLLWNKETCYDNTFTIDNYINSCKSSNSLNYYQPNKSRLITLIPFLHMCNIKHCYSKGFGHDYKYLHKEKISDILIALIENRIKDPQCGFNLIGETSQDLKQMFKIFNNKNLLDNFSDTTVSISFKQDDINRYNTEFKEQLAIKWYNICHDQCKQTIDDIINKFVDDLKKCQIVQNELEVELDKIQYDLYYSSRNKIIYSEDKLSKISHKCVIKDHCQLFKIKHISIYIFNNEFEDLFEMINNYEKINTIKNKFSSMKA